MRLSEAEAKVARTDALLVEFEEFRQEVREQIESVLSTVPGARRSSTDVLHQAAESLQDKYIRVLNEIGVMNWGDSISAQHFVASGELRFLKLFVERFPGAIIFDIGANVGRYATLVMKLNPTAIVHAFEPHPTAFGLLKAAAAEHGFTPHQVALGEEPGNVVLFDKVNENGSEHASLYRDVIERVHHKNACQITVPCQTVDRMARKLRVKHINLLKIDVEGHELQVLRGASGTLKKKIVDVIQFEFNEMNVFSRTFFKDFSDYLVGFRFYRLLPDSVLDLGEYSPRSHEIFAFQNVVCVREDRL